MLIMHGICHPVILFPKKTEWEKESEIAYVLEHEYVHIKRCDSITKLLVTGVSCIHWFNPLVWVMYILFNRDLELACDEEVIHQFGSHSKAEYARTLIAMEEQKSGYMPLCNNFSKNAIEERITAIMKMKKTSMVMLLAATVMIVGVTVVFASSAKAHGNETAYLTEEVSGVSDEKIEYQELLKEYERFGITDENGILYYKGELVRLFLDGYENGETLISRYTKLNEDGIVDVHTVRNDEKNEDGSTMLFGEITDIVPYTQEEFEARDVSWYRKQIGNGEVTAAEEGNDSGNTIEQYFKQFESYGITYQKTSSNLGNIYWNGELIGEFWDEKPDGSIFLTESELSSSVAVHTKYDENGKLLGISYLSEDDNILTSIQESDMFSKEENGEIYYSADGGKTFLDEKEFNEIYPSQEVEWWTYEEYKEWLDNERKVLQDMLGEKAWTGGRGEFVWTQEIIDETIAQYEAILQEIKNGVKISKTVNGSDDIQLAIYDDEEHFMESAEGVAIAVGNETKVFGQYESKEELLNAIKTYCEEQVYLGNITQQEAEEIIKKYE